MGDADRHVAVGLSSIVSIVTIEIMTATTITISEDLKRDLLKVAAQLQASRGQKIDYDDVLRYLVRRATRNMALFRQACAPTGVSSRELRKQLAKGREEDRKKELSLERRHS